jgi:hypothetical protein
MAIPFNLRMQVRQDRVAGSASGEKEATARPRRRADEFV